MEMSPQINELAAALSKAQGTIGGAHKDAKNPFYKSKYANLASVVDAIREPFAANGLSFSQGTISAGASYTLRTVILHSSGQWLASSLTAAPVKPDPQSVGSLISYLKRYGLQAMCGVASIDDVDDDDAEAACGRAKEVEPREVEPKKVEPKKVDIFDKDSANHRERVAKALGNMKVDSALFPSVYAILHGAELTKSALKDAVEEVNLQNDIKI